MLRELTLQSTVERGRWGAGPGGEWAASSGGYSECVGVFGCRPERIRVQDGRCTRRACWGGSVRQPRSCRCGRRLGHRRWTSPTGIRWRRGMGGPAFRGFAGLVAAGLVFADVTLPRSVPIQGLDSSGGVGCGVACVGGVEGEQTMLRSHLGGVFARKRGCAGVCDWRHWAGGGVGGLARSTRGLPVLSVRQLMLRPVSAAALSGRPPATGDCWR